MLISIQFQCKILFTKMYNFFMVPFGKRAYYQIELHADTDESIAEIIGDIIKKCKKANFSYGKSYGLLEKEITKFPYSIVGWEKIFRSKWDEI